MGCDLGHGRYLLSHQQRRCFRESDSSDRDHELVNVPSRQTLDMLAEAPKCLGQLWVPSEAQNAGIEAVSEQVFRRWEQMQERQNEFVNLEHRG